MSRRPGSRRLARLIYAYTAICVVGAVGIFLLVATWHFARRGPPERRPLTPEVAQAQGHRPPPGAMPPPGDRPPPPGRHLPPPPRPSPSPPPDLLLLVGGILLVLVSIASFFFTQRITRPLRKLEEAALAFGSGDHAARARIEHDDELGAAGKAFDEMADRTTKLLRAHQELLANVSHELRTPLARMRVAIDLAKESEAPARGPLIDSLELDVAELESLVGDVLMSLRTAMTDELRDLETIDLGALIDELVAAAAARYPTRELVVKRGAEGLGCRAERELLRRAFANLLDNALKYSEGAIELRLGEQGRHAIVEIEDHGIGIPAADLEHVFTPFFRSDRSRHRKTGGVGLGLNLVKRIVEAHGGSVAISSEEGRGTTVRLELERA